MTRAAVPEEKPLSVNSRGSSMGRAVRNSWNTNRMIAKTAATNAAITEE